MKYVLSLSCPDRPGIVHAISGFLLNEHANIVEAAQFNDPDTGLFFSRVKFELLQPLRNDPAGLPQRFEPIAREFAIQAKFAPADVRMPTVIMVSQLGHCLNDLLFRYRSGLLPIDIRAIVSNHRTFYQLAASYEIPFHHIVVKPETKPSAEAKLMEIFDNEGAQLLVLARYMQVLSDDLCKRLAGRAINIHHSFLPAFAGAKPYHQAFQRGVKVIGATAHFVTNELDSGPIIVQQVIPVDHSHTPQSLVQAGRDVEQMVLSRALRLLLEDRIFLCGNRTIIFD